MLGCFATCDVENLGDLLYPVILQRLLAECGWPTDLRAYGFLPGPAPGDAGYPVHDIHDLLGPRREPLDTLIIGGGDILRTDTAALAQHYMTALVARAGRAPDAAQTPEVVVEDFIRRHFGYPAPGPFLFDRRDYPNLDALAYLSCGVPHVFAQEGRGRVRECLESASFVWVRDQLSRQKLLEAGVQREVQVAPDLVTILSDFFPHSAMHQAGRVLLAEAGVDVARRIVCFQVCPVLDPKQESMLIEELGRLRERLDAEIVLLPIGYVYGDDRMLQRLARLSERRFRYLDVRRVHEQIAVIAASDLFIGTSMHGNIIAFSYGIPCLCGPIRPDKLIGYLDVVNLPSDLKLRDWSETVEKAEFALDLPRDYFAKRAQDAKRHVREVFAQFCAAIGRRPRVGLDVPDQPVAVSSPAPHELRERLGAILRAEEVPAAVLLGQVPRRTAADAGIWLDLGNAFGRKLRWAHAELCLREAVQLAPDNTEARCNLGVVLEARGLLTCAVAHFEGVLALQPQNPEVLRKLTFIYCEIGHLEEAQACGERLRDVPGQEEAEADHLRGRIHERRGEREPALECYAAALAAAPDYFDARLHLANFLLIQGCCEEAVAHYRLIIRQQPRHAGARNNLAIALARLGRSTAAADVYAQALQINPHHTVARKNLELVQQELSAYALWNTRYHALTDRDRALIRERLAVLGDMPTISLLLSVRDADPQRLPRAIEAVERQLYDRWELCVAVPDGIVPDMRRWLEERGARDPRIRLVTAPGNGSRAESANAALAAASGGYVAVLGEHDEIAEHALYLIVEEVNRIPGAVVLYGDEDRIDDQGHRFDPFFKPQWNPDLLLSQNYIGALVVCRTEDIRREGGFERCHEGYHEWGVLLRLTASADESGIRHIPFVLYHRRVTADGDEPRGAVADPAGAAAMIEAHLARRGCRASVAPTLLPVWRVRYPVPEPAPLVTVIIPTRNGRALLERCVDSIFTRTRYCNYELLIVDNQSDEPDSLEYLRALADDPRIRVIPYDAPFNYSAICNHAVRAARGSVIALLNNDTEMISPDWLDEMVGHALRPEVGVVGAMLYYPDDTIQHAGVAAVYGEGYVYHLNRRQPRGFRDPRARARATQNLLAVTGACQVLRKAVYEEVGGMDEDRLRIAFNDVDLCLKIRERGHRVVWTPWSELYHHESASRGYLDAPEKALRESREHTCFRERWSAILDADPATNPNIRFRKGKQGLAEPHVRKPWIV